MLIRFLFIIAGLFCISKGIVLFVQMLKFLENSKIIEGKVIEIGERKDSKSRTYFFPIFEYFDDAEGKICCYMSSTGYNPSKYMIGDVAELIYKRQNDVSKLCVNTKFAKWGSAVVCFTIGVGFCIINVALFL